MVKTLHAGSRWLMLRGAHKIASTTMAPPPRELADYPDMWTHLFAEVVRQAGGIGEIWCKGPACDVRFECGGLVRRHRMEFREFDDFQPDIIWQRGGYPDYRPVLGRNPNALKVYYGAGCHWRPPGRSCFDLVLVDCKAQLDELARLCPAVMCKLLIKPAVETIFKPLKIRKQYDVVFVCSHPREFKGAGWLAKRLPDGTRVLRIGPPDKWFVREAESGRLRVKFAGQTDPKDIPREACKAKMGAVVDDGRFDSGPRVLPEMLAMNIPVLVRDSVRVDQGRYVNPWTGLLVNNKNFAMQFSHMKDSWETYAPREWYDSHIAVKLAAGKLLKQILACLKAKRCH